MSAPVVCVQEKSREPYKFFKKTVQALACEISSQSNVLSLRYLSKAFRFL
jgi:hypothetical protein